MNSNAIQFQCGSCQATLTVPAHMAGVSGPCPTCGRTVTSPAATAPTPLPTFGGNGLLGGRGTAPASPSHPNGTSQFGGHPGTANPMAPFPPGRPLGSAPEGPAWQQPGLGQTMLNSHQPPAPASPMSPPPAQAATDSFLPPRRPTGLPPLAGAPSTGPLNAWGPTPSPGVPHAPPAPSMAAPMMATPPAPDPRALWNSREAPVAAPPGVMAQAQSVPSVQLPPPRQPMPTMEEPRRPRMPVPQGGKRPMPRWLLATFVLTVIGGGLWMGREPLRKMISGDEQPAEDIPYSPPETEPSLPKIEPKVPEGSAEIAGNFNPEEPSAEPPAALPANKPPTVVAKAAPAGSGLMEVTSRPVEAGVKSSPSSESGVENLSYTPPKLDAVPPEAMAAAEALQKFLAAKDLEERMRYTLAPETMREYMERYYAVNSSGPVQVDTIAYVRLDPKPQVGSGAHAVFGLECRAWQFPVPVMLEETEDGFRVDWLSFVEFKDRLLERFFKEYTEGPARFHVGLTRAHYFEDGVPNADKKDAFTVSTAPPNPFQATVFVDKESPLGKQLKERVSWGTQVWAIAELEWIKLGGKQWIELAAVPQLNWYSVPSNKTTQQTIQPARAPDSPTEVQRAVPIGR